MKKTKLLLILILLVAIFIRFWGLSKIPVSLFGDELDVGYHALSILKTGSDYYGNFLPLSFHSIAEWRTPLFLYSAVSTVAIWGVSPLGVRVPAAIFGILGIFAMYLFVKEVTKKDTWALLSAALLTISPWHIQYSRAGFEVTMLLAFLLFGLYFFFKGLKEGKYMWISAFFLVITPLIYSTAKLFTPFLLVFLLFAYRKEIFSLSKKYLVWATIALFLFGLPTAYSTLFEGGTQRFNYISVFSDPTTESEVGTARLRDARMRGELGLGLQPTLFDRAIHNKYTWWAAKISANYVQAFSTDFLFINGDPNPRQSPNGVGEFYKFEIIFLILGLVLFFARYKDKRTKKFIAYFLLIAPIPAALTRDGGNHATRLILMLIPFVFLISYGILEGISLFKKNWKKLAILVTAVLYLSAFIFYQHNYTFHYPWDSERWWHAGWGDAVGYVKENQANYDRVFITMADEPAWIFFAGWYEYPPSDWQKNFPIDNKVDIDGFGEISHINKFYFGAPNADGGIYGLPKYITKKDLYLASAKEVPGNLIMNPGQVPIGLKLLKAVAFPSGEPAFYLFTKAD